MLEEQYALPALAIELDKLHGRKINIIKQKEMKQRVVMLLPPDFGRMSFEDKRYWVMMAKEAIKRSDNNKI